MEQTMRVPNPVTGRTDDGTDVLPVTPLMLAGRYLLALLVPTWVLVWQLTDGVAVRWPLLVGFVVAVYFATAAAYGSWWRWPGAAQPGWNAMVVAQMAVLVLGVVVSIATGEPLVLAFAATLLIGAVLGAAALQGWELLRSRQRRV